MMLSTRRKIALARLASQWIIAARRIFACGHQVETIRGGVKWSLNLKEGIDFAIYLLGTFESDTVTAYRRLISEGDVVIDIGANMGAHTLQFARCVGESGHVLALEPTTSAFQRLTKNIACNPNLAHRITAIQAMLVADEKDSIEPAIYSSWPLHPHAEAHNLHLGVQQSTEGAQALTLGQAIEKVGIDHVNLIKMDVDGFEPEVLQGARETLERHRPPIVMELAPYTIEERGRDPRAPITLLQELGYVFQDLSGRSLSTDDKPVPDIPAGSSINMIAVCK